MMATMHKTAVAYLRTSSLSNVGADKDSDKRQRDAIEAYAAAHGIEIVREFYDAGVSGADAVTEREGFNAMLTYMLGNGARIVLVENASRFARDLIVQLTGHALLKQHGIELIPVDAPSHFEDETPTATMVRSILGAVSQFEKEALVLKLRKARDRKRKEEGRCEGNPQWSTVPAEHAAAARALRQRGLSLRETSGALDALGFVGRENQPYKPGSIASMLETTATRTAKRKARMSVTSNRTLPQILRKLAEGLSVSQIARNLLVTEETVKQLLAQAQPA